MMVAVRRRRIRSGFATVRDALSYAAGMVVLGHEVFFADRVDWLAVLVGMGLLGLPLAVGGGEPKPPNRPGR